ncbi:MULTISPECIES: SMC-Scp complex subunit ScpB [unclassified Clostridium]|uniref:SMC-Scp complex subunit ScpB n=1 Tax=unclassified Clostridium TaxID=2614128 RepID=UPI0032177134
MNEHTNLNHEDAEVNDKILSRVNKEDGSIDIDPRNKIEEVLQESEHQLNYLIDESKYERYFSIIESLLYVTGDPLEVDTIASILECSVEFATELLKVLEKVYERDESRGVKLICINKAYQLGTKPINSDYLQMLLKTNIRQSLSRASLETLSIIAYKQPITRIEIEDIRGVKSDRAISTLVEKGLIKESGKKSVIGRPNLYATTDEFLKHFDFTSLGELPSLDNFIEDEELVELEEKDIEEKKF